MSDRQQQQKRDLPLKESGTYRNEEDNDAGRPPQGRKQGGSYFRGDFGKRNPRHQHGSCEVQPSHLRKYGGNVDRRGALKYRARHTPYTVGQEQRRVQWHKEGQIRVSLGGNRKHLKSEMGEDKQGGTQSGWFKITIPVGKTYEKTWLMNSIQSHCTVPFTPVDFHYTQHKVHFFVQDASAASALMGVSYKICDEENKKIPIFVNSSAAPYSVQEKLAPEKMKQLKLTMRRRYDVSRKALDLQSLRYDPGTVDRRNTKTDLVRHDTDIILNRRNCMTATLQIIKTSFPELLSLNLHNNRLFQLDGLSDITHMVPTVRILNLSKNELNCTWELGKIKGLKLEELWLEGNPLCDTFPDQSAYIRGRGILGRIQGFLSQVLSLNGSIATRTINHFFLLLDLDSAIRECFPKLCRLDGQDLRPPITADIDRPNLTKPYKGSYKGPDAVKSLVLQFLEQYYLVYDSGDRQRLLSAYHDEACFSLAIPFNPNDPDPSSFFEYFKHNRNMKTLKDPNLRFQLLKHTKRDIVCSLCVLPKTQHDFSSFILDMCVQSESMIFVCVSGVFKEVEGRSQGCMRAFSRTFIATPASSSSLCVVNEELFVRDTTPRKTQSALSSCVPTPHCSSQPTLSQEQQEMVQVSFRLSQMSL